MHRLAVFAATVFALAPAALEAADGRARTLHDTYCVMCHGTQVYTRADRLAKDYAGVREQVDRWQKNVSLNWSQTDIDAVTDYLAARYYKVACPTSC